MAKKEKLIPFRWFPASWGLVGAAFEEAKAHYELEGEDLERRLVNIRITNSVELEHAILKLDHQYERISDYDFEIEEATLLEGGTISPKNKLGIDLRHEKISGYEHDCKMAALNYPDANSLDHQVALLTADYEHGKIERLEYEKTLATAKKEPWVGIVDNGFNPEDGVNGLYFELDWNEQWVDHLRKNGYHGFNDEQIVEQWFSDVCRSQADDNAPIDDAPVPFNSGRVINRRRDGGSTEYS